MINLCKLKIWSPRLSLDTSKKEMSISSKIRRNWIIWYRWSRPTSRKVQSFSMFVPWRKNMEIDNKINRRIIYRHGWLIIHQKNQTKNRRWWYQRSILNMIELRWHMIRHLRQEMRENHSKNYKKINIRPYSTKWNKISSIKKNLKMRKRIIRNRNSLWLKA